MLEIKDIYKSFGEQKVLQGLNMNIDKGKIYTIIGGNGAGKTTLFNLITGFLKPDKGELWFNNKKLKMLNPVFINSEGITRTFQDLRTINQLSVKENLLLSFKNNPGEIVVNSILPPIIFKKKYFEIITKTEEIIEKLNLDKIENILAGRISYGQQKLLTIGCCLSNDAQLILLDEPVAGIDVENTKRILNLIIQLKKEGKTIIQIEHTRQYIESFDDGIWYLYAGKASFYKNYKSFINDRIVKETYLN